MLSASPWSATAQFAWDYSAGNKGAHAAAPHI